MLYKLLFILIIIPSGLFAFDLDLSKERLIIPDTINAPGVERLDTLKNFSPVRIAEIIITGNKVTQERIILRDLYLIKKIVS